MKCKDCNCCTKGWFSYKPDAYVCTGVKEPFIISDIEHECTEYPELRDKVSIENAIAHFKYGITHDIFKEPVTSYAKMAVEALEKQMLPTPLPCPFCGNENVEVITSYDLDYGSKNEFLVHCFTLDDGCGACGGVRDSKQEAIEAWNRRK